MKFLKRFCRKKKNMNFGYALETLKMGRFVAREGWNGKGMFITLIQPENWKLDNIAEKKLVGDRQLPWIGMRTAQAEFVPWVASQTDLLATDWVEVYPQKG